MFIQNFMLLAKFTAGFKFDRISETEIYVDTKLL